MEMSRSQGARALNPAIRIMMAGAAPHRAAAPTPRPGWPASPRDSESLRPAAVTPGTARARRRRAGRGAGGAAGYSSQSLRRRGYSSAARRWRRLQIRRALDALLCAHVHAHATPHARFRCVPTPSPPPRPLPLHAHAPPPPRQNAGAHTLACTTSGADSALTQTGDCGGGCGFGIGGGGRPPPAAHWPAASGSPENSPSHHSPAASAGQSPPPPPPPPPPSSWP